MPTCRTVPVPPPKSPKRVPIAKLKELRQLTQVPYLECKKALQTTDGNINKAQELLRRAGWARWA